MNQSEPDKIGEVECETHLGNRQKRFDRHVFAIPPGLRTMLDSVFRRPRKIGLVIKDRLEDCARVVKR